MAEEGWAWGLRGCRMSLLLLSWCAGGLGNWVGKEEEREGEITNNVVGSTLSPTPIITP